MAKSKIKSLIAGAVAAVTGAAPVAAPAVAVVAEVATAVLAAAAVAAPVSAPRATAPSEGRTLSALSSTPPLRYARQRREPGFHGNGKPNNRKSSKHKRRRHS